MRHRVAGKKLNRDKDHRESLLKNLAISVLLHGKVETSITKAKFVRPFVEKLITKAKNNSYSSLRDLRTNISNEHALKKLFSEIAPVMLQRPGGYTRIKRLGVIRKGDNSEMATFELVTNELALKKDLSIENKKSDRKSDKALNKKIVSNTSNNLNVNENSVSSSDTEVGSDSASLVKEEENK